jgi:hypothetical protein
VPAASEALRTHGPPGANSAAAMPPTLPLGRLLLDKENPRLAAGNHAVKQEDLIKTLWSQMDAEEIALSILANGYLPEEPLLVYKERQGGKYVVVEGNRRLAAILVLRDKALREKVRATHLPALTRKQYRELDELPVSIYPSRKSLWKYTGFHHINGPKQWDSFSKAKYVAHVHRSYGVGLDHIARTIGDRFDFVRRIYRGYRVLEKAQAECDFDIQDRTRSKFAFSHLYTALSDRKFQSFLGLKETSSLSGKLVPRSKLSNLCQLMM